MMNGKYADIKGEIKRKICLAEMIPNYPLGAFVKWVDEEGIAYPVVALLLGRIQSELDAEELVLRGARPISVSVPHLTLHGYWRLYCSQVRAYYKAILRDPNNKKRLEFLLHC